MPSKRYEMHRSREKARRIAAARESRQAAKDGRQPPQPEESPPAAETPGPLPYHQATPKRPPAAGPRGGNGQLHAGQTPAAWRGRRPDA